jgi:hypothetical protein
MGQRDAFVDVAAVQAIADQFAATAEFIDVAARINRWQLAFGGVTAGRAHIAHGDALRLSLNRLTDELSQWSRATLEIAVALRATADSYAEAELRSTERIG